jgi:gluconate 2-dehydrogenase gamma chain
MTLLIDRRTALFSGLAAAWTVPTVAAAQGAVMSWTPKGVSPDQARTLAAACERILPATRTPGAGAFGVPQFVDRAVATWCAPEDAERMRAGLAKLDADSRSRFGAPFAAASAEQQDALLTAVEAESRSRRPHFFVMLRELATTGYFHSQQGATQVLRYDPVPGAYRGCVPLAEIGRGWAI